ncbi:BTB/POZ domain-containing protein At5g60050 [Cynara cardunculus var. scolymus]|uniref:BTB/POZ fold n=1 Tax=Cynara cardunculus var. scolymus TaxID=59895 RepID=A0A103Y6U1_CYNCS|nr:BTB/POZ domain-containing protein At5g60050 [Cynara cardunculus var. scolymus]KVI03582.1 BTB/POZ fold [Cynara cardunculus var. scolymus]
MASSDLNNTQAYNKSKQQVSTMLKQGFISDFFLSPPPSSSPSDPIRPLQSPIRSTPSPTLFEMMTDEHTRDSRHSVQKMRIEGRVARVLSGAPFRNPADWGLGIGDVKLTITGRDGFSVSMDVHREVLASRSQFFKEKLGRRSGSHHSVEICECDDVEVYLETLVLMYCDDPKKMKMGEGVSKILGLLKVCDALKFDDGISSCLEYLEAVPWSEEEEESVISHLNELHLVNDCDVLQRVALDPSTSSRIDDIFLRLLTGVLQAKDEKARREMKTLISRLLKEDASESDHGYDYHKLEISKETLYTVSHKCLTSLVLCLSEATSTDENKGMMAEIAREADNLEWVVDILIEKRICEEFVKLWSDQKDLAILHSKVPIMFRHKVSRITAQLCIAIGRGNILVPKETRVSLLSTWLEALYDDFGWMKRGSRNGDRRLIEDGISQIILTLPLLQQQAFLMSWFDRFLEKGDDCPNIQRAFEIWWRRAFVRQPVVEPQLQITVCDYPS